MEKFNMYFHSYHFLTAPYVCTVFRTCMITCLQNIGHSFECSYYLGINVATHLNMW